jgi:hypothetical protein
MKKIFILLISFIIITIPVFSQTFEMRTYLNDYDYVAVQLRQTALGSQPDALSNTDGDEFSDMVFTLRWLQSYGNVDVDVICTDYNITESSPRTTLDTYYYQKFGISAAFICPVDYVLNEWVTIATIETNLGSGSTSGTFELAPNTWAGNLLATISWDGSGSLEYFPTLVTGACNNTPIPTIVYDYVWLGGGVGGFESNWFMGGNWTSACGVAQSAAPNSTNNVYIPDVSGASGYFPDANLSATMACKNLRIASGSYLSVPETNGSLAIAEELRTYGILKITPNANVTVTGNTYVEEAASIEVQATSAGVGSFIDNGTITYGGSGTATVQIYLSNSAGVGSFDIHLIGPTVDEENYTGTGTGAYLEEFILDGVSTYAYEWDESVVSTSAWVNLTSLTDEIYSGKGIGLSATDNDNHTLSMTGALMTGSVSSPALTYSSNHIELISNPYPSAIDFDGLAGTDNSTQVQNKYWIYNPAADNYVANATPYSGDDKYIQVGQGFFVEMKQAGTFDFTNARRAHSNVAFRDLIPNKLTVKVFGGQEGYEDKLSVRFDDYATNGYDIEIEAKKWESQNNDATQIRSIAEDNTELSINVLPTESLYSGMTSVPMHFSCGYNTEYSLSFFDIESFEYGTEIWLEDKQVGGDWVSVNDNPDYTFTATPDDLEDRFVIHFFGPTGVDEFGIENTVNIYSYRQNAFVRNNTNEAIKRVSIYTLSGELVQEINTVDLKLSKFWVSNNMGYYVVRVITDKNVYTNKVFISK